MTEPVLKYAAALDMPDTRRAGYYAQIVKALAGKTALFDRDKELMIFSSREELEQLRPILEQYAIPSEELNVLLLPTPVTTYPAFGDYGFVSRLENVYLYADLVAVFRLRAAADTNGPLGRAFEPRQAEAQLEEHLLAAWPEPGGGSAFVIEAQLAELAEGIARAYGGVAEWIYCPQG
ncbi:hypothetical protein P4H70_16970 [Paenibacillus ehimensis]|uniref:hypothetical protein n=1 Tax=Paenibacillus ehimensis TaxID=79264 RepID=UPI002DBDD787|nr:hypothetical protein [Paenibacillus ehimensis]MEC0210631.1 hypothetical protein [Paenibacillus ehimensis]